MPNGHAYKHNHTETERSFCQIFGQKTDYMSQNKKIDPSAPQTDPAAQTPHTSKEGKSGKKKGKNVFLITFGIAVLCVVLLFVAAYLLGFQYRKITASDGSTVKFFGMVNKEGIPQSGTLYYSNGVSAKIHKSANKVTFSDGSVYEGELGTSLLMEGEGTQTDKEGNVYQGSFSGGLFNGQGTLTSVNGDVYTGSFVNGKKEGEGVYTRKDGSSYTGSFSNGKKNGYGVYIWADGSKYEGYYQDDLKSGEGTFTFSNGDIYTGSFENDARNGQGTYTWKESGDQYVGQFKDNLMNGEGTYTYSSGRTYTGLFENGNRVLDEEAVVPQSTQAAETTDTQSTT